jgi:hypothetical protein
VRTEEWIVENCELGVRVKVEGLVIASCEFVVRDIGLGI